MQQIDRATLDGSAQQIASTPGLPIRYAAMDAEYTVRAEAANMRSSADSSCAVASEDAGRPDDARLLMLPPSLLISGTSIGHLGVACQINEMRSARGLREVGDG